MVEMLKRRIPVVQEGDERGQADLAVGTFGLVWPSGRAALSFRARCAQDFMMGVAELELDLSKFMAVRVR